MSSRLFPAIVSILVTVSTASYADDCAFIAAESDAYLCGCGRVQAGFYVNTVPLPLGRGENEACVTCGPIIGDGSDDGWDLNDPCVALPCPSGWYGISGSETAGIAPSDDDVLDCGECSVDHWESSAQIFNPYTFVMKNNILFARVGTNSAYEGQFEEHIADMFGVRASGQAKFCINAPFSIEKDGYLHIIATELVRATFSGPPSGSHVVRASWEITGPVGVGTSSCSSADFILDSADSDDRDDWSECGASYTVFLPEGDYVFSLEYEYDVIVVSEASPSSQCCQGSVGGFAFSPSDEFQVRLQLTCDDEYPCWGDLNGDSQIGFADLTILLSAYGTTVCDAAYNPMADLNNDGQVGLADYTILASLYGLPC